MHHFLLAAFKIFCFGLLKVSMMYLGVDLFWLTPLGVLWASWIFILMVSIYRRFGAIISLTILSPPFSSLLLGLSLYICWYNWQCPTISWGSVDFFIILFSSCSSHWRIPINLSLSPQFLLPTHFCSWTPLTYFSF